MRIGLISDTRVPGGANEVPQEVKTALEGVDLILHAGGIHVPSVLDWLEDIAPVMAVGRIHGGQAERPTPLALESMSDARVSELLVLPIEGHTIGMVNNLELDGFSEDILPGALVRTRLRTGPYRRWWNTSSGRRSTSWYSVVLSTPWSRSTRASSS